MDITFGNYVSYIQADAEQHADLRIIADLIGSTLRADGLSPAMVG